MAVAGTLTGPPVPRWSWLVSWAALASESESVAAGALPSFAPALLALPWSLVAAAR
jgi:hypothetical protein